MRDDRYTASSTSWVTSRSLDCVSIFARDVATAAAAARLAGASPDDGADGWRRRPEWPEIPAAVTVGVPAVDRLSFDGDPDGPQRWLGAVDRLRTLLESRVPDAPAVAWDAVDVEPFVATGALLYEGAFVAERYDAVGAFVDAGSPDLDPVVAGIISRAASLPAWRLFGDIDELARRRRITERAWECVDVIVVPSVPRVPTVAEVVAAPIAVNSMLGTYTNFVNLLDLAAVTIPVPFPADPAGNDRPPFSVTLIGPAWSDELLIALAAAMTREPSPLPA